MFFSDFVLDNILIEEKSFSITQYATRAEQKAQMAPDAKQPQTYRRRLKK